MKEKAKNYITEELSGIITKRLQSLKEEIGDSLSLFELKTLYNNKLYGQDAMFVHERFDEISIELDNIINKYCDSLKDTFENDLRLSLGNEYVEKYRA